MNQAVDASRIPELQAVARMALDEARRAGADQAEADVSLQQGLNVTVRLGEVETLEYQRDRGLSITVYFQKAKGSASSADLRPEAVRDMVAKACAIARHTARDECAGLADPDQLARDIPDLQLDHPWDVTPESAIELTRACEAAGLAVDRRLTNSEGASLSTHRGVHVYANSHGFLAGYPSSSHSLSCVLLAQDGDDMQRDYAWTAARNPAALEPLEAIGRRAGERAVARLGARQLETRKAPVIFCADLARGFFGHLVAAVRGSSQYRKASFLLDAAGTQVLPAWLQLQERPHLPAGLASSPFDGEGVATRDRELVRDGVLQGYVLGSYSARKLGLQTTGNAGGIHNLLVQGAPGAPDLQGLLRQMGEGFYVTELLGQGVNGVTGDYSRGASGFWVSGGEIGPAVHEVTIAGNLRQMYRDVVAVATDVDRRGAIQSGSVLVDGLTIAGQ
ncbi:MAG: peptidase PmbA [Pseudomonadota bacterium]|jgi:PmbA protein